MSDSSGQNTRGVCRPTFCSALVGVLHVAAAVCSVLALVTVWDTISVEAHSLSVDIGEADFKGLSFKGIGEGGSEVTISWADSDSECQGTKNSYATAALRAVRALTSESEPGAGFAGSAAWCEDVHTTAAWLTPGLVGLAVSVCVDLLMAIAIAVWVVKTCKGSGAHSFARSPKLACCVTAAGLPLAVACTIGRALLLVGGWVNVAKTDAQLADVLTQALQEHTSNNDAQVTNAGFGPGALWLLGATVASLITIPIAIKARKVRNDSGYVPQVDADGFGSDARGVALVGGAYEPPGGRV